MNLLREDVQEISRLAGLWATARVRKALVAHGVGALHETAENTSKRERKANAEFHEYLRMFLKENQS